MEYFSYEFMNIQQQNKETAQMNRAELKAMNFINGFKMFQAWRMSLSIYKIDNEIFDEMLKSPIPLDTPSEVFGRFVPPSTPRVHSLGQRLGEEIRKFKNEIAESDENRKGTAKRPHIRKGHLYRSGYPQRS